MKVLVAIPSFSNFRFGYSIKWTLENLVNQSFRDFRVLIVYKPSPGDRTLDVIDGFRDKLDIEVKIQNEGFVEEAMNMIFEAAKDYDLLLTIDDDAIPSRTWVEEHLNLHKQFNDVGIARGLINRRRLFEQEYGSVTYEYPLFKPVRALLNYYKPLMSEFSNYTVYINIMGLEVFGVKFRFTPDLKIVKTFPLGVNMSIKPKILSGFKLLNYTLRGLGYEPLITLHAVLHDFHAIMFEGAYVEHLDRDSLSKPRTPKGLFMRYVESMLFPYAVHKLLMSEGVNIDIDLKRLKIYYNLVKVYSWLRKTIMAKAYETGLRLAIEAIENNYEPKEVRNKLIKLNEKSNIMIN